MAHILKFREQSNYKDHFNMFGEAIRAYKQIREIRRLFDFDGDLEDAASVDGLEDLMLASYRFMKFIREFNNCISQVRPIEFKIALKEVEEILDEPLEYCVPMYKEADALEALSFSIFKILKENNKLEQAAFFEGQEQKPSVNGGWWCKHCNMFCSQPCKKHIGMRANRSSFDSNTVDHKDFVHGMFFCEQCKGFLDVACELHPRVML